MIEHPAHARLEHPLLALRAVFIARECAMLLRQLCTRSVFEVPYLYPTADALWEPLVNAKCIWLRFYFAGFLESFN
jgi:hypothetical protein